MRISIWKPLAAFFILLGGWEVCVLVADIPKWLLPAPSTITLEFIHGWGELSPHLVSTIYLILLGFLIGSLVGMVTAFLFHTVPFLKDAFYPILILSQNVPIIVLAPLLVIWFGFGLLPKLIVIMLVCFFPVAVATLDGFRQTPVELMHYLKMAGATNRQIFWKLEFPSALPALFSGLKISATYSVMGAVISEWLGAKVGIGVYMTLASSSFRTDRVFVAIFIVMVLSLLFFACIVFLERLFVHWQKEETH